MTCDAAYGELHGRLPFVRSLLNPRRVVVQQRHALGTGMPVACGGRYAMSSTDDDKATPRGFDMGAPNIGHQPTRAPLRTTPAVLLSRLWYGM